MVQISASSEELSVRKASKRLTIVHGFRPKSENFGFVKKRILSERASQEEHIGTNFSFVAPSSEEL